LLEPVRQYAAQQLAASGEREPVASRHAAWYLALAERAAPELRGPDQVAWLSRLDHDYDNLRAALGQAEHSGDVETSARLAGALVPFWEVRGAVGGGRGWLETGLGTAHPRPVSPAVTSA